MTEENKKTCGDCAKYRKSTCKRREYRDNKLNDIAVMPTDGVCDEFEEKKNPSTPRRQNQANRLVTLCLAQKPIIFHDQHKTPYARLKQKNVNVTIPIHGKSFKSWLANLMWKNDKKAPGTEAIYSALKILEAKALFEGKQHKLHNRVAKTTDSFWIDMADDRWRAIKVTKEGWQIANEPPILFQRYSHQKPLYEPDSEGDPWAFLDFVNIEEDDQDSRLLLLCAIISYYIPDIPHVILVLHGIQGTGKSTLLKLIRRLVDPSVVELLTLPRNEAERVQQLSHHWCAFFDNITYLPVWMSDCLCRAATGGGFSKRVLYTDDEDLIYNFKRCVALNGINIAAQRGDLLDRSLLIGLKNITKTSRKTEDQLLDEFEKQRPKILAGFLNTLVKAIHFYPTVNPKELFRMADFTKWGCAISLALGKTEEDFISAYERKVKVQIEEAAYSSPLANVLLHFMEVKTDWEGSPTDLFSELCSHAKAMGISSRQKAWPKAPNILVRQLNELIPSLKELGLNVVTGVRTGSTRRIMMNIVTTVTTDNKSKQSDDNDDSDGSGNTSSCLVNDVKSLTPLTGNIVDSCFFCKKRGRMDWQVTKHNKEWGFLCSDCGFKLQKQLGEEKIDKYFKK